MNYQKIYNDLINYAKAQVINDEYHEIHHINPASMCKVSKRYGIKDTFVWDMDADIPDNLVKLTPKQHYIAHVLLAKMFKQMIPCLVILNGDNSRAYTLAQKMLSAYRKEQYANGEHNLCGLNKTRIDNGTHNFLKREDGSSISSETQQRRILNGTFHFQGDTGSALATARNKDMIKKGTHISVNDKAKEKSQKTRKARIDSGNWHTCGIKPWNNNSTKEYPKYIYSQAHIIFDLWSTNTSYGSRKLATLLNMKWSTTHDRLVKMFRDGWVPSLDTDWVKFKQSCGGEQ